MMKIICDKYKSLLSSRDVGCSLALLLDPLEISVDALLEGFSLEKELLIDLYFQYNAYGGIVNKQKKPVYLTTF